MSVRKISKEWRKMAKRLEGQGFDVVLTNGGHVKVTGRDGRKVFLAATPSDSRSWKNGLAQLRRIGADV